MHLLQTFILKLAVQFIPLHMLLIIEKQLQSPQLSGICSTFVHIENYVCLVFANQDKQKQKKGKTIYSFPMHTVQQHFSLPENASQTHQAKSGRCEECQLFEIVYFTTN